MPTGTIRSKQMTLRNKTHEVTFFDAVRRGSFPRPTQEPPAPAQAAAAGPPLISAANGPIDITANRLDINDASKIATFSGSVRAVQGDAALETSALTVNYASQKRWRGAPRRAPAPRSSASSRALLSS